MLKLQFILAISLFLCGYCRCQENDDLYYNPGDEKVKIDLKSVPKGTWKIEIQTNISKEDNYQLIGETLVINNYQIKNANKDFYSITTVPKAHEKLNSDYILNFVARDSLIFLTGTFKLNVTLDLGSVESDFSYDKIKNKGQNGSPLRESFRKMFEFALKLSDIDKMRFIYE